MIRRELQDRVIKSLFKGKVIVIYGARQVGKTTLLREIQKKYATDSVFLNCDEPDIRSAFTVATSTQIGRFIGNKKLVLLDEAQRVADIGLTLKLMHDTFPQVQIIATGSSSFELSNKVVEPLTGRKYEFWLYPFSVRELKTLYSPVELRRMLEERIIFGMYPEAVNQRADAEDIIKSIARDYFYKDILRYQDIRNPEILEKLLQALALHSRNHRKELAKLRKVYFYDTGLRNALINNFNSFGLRADVGSLWENFWISERIKNNQNDGRGVNMYFWRSYSKQEIDYVEESGGQLAGYECKWNTEKKHKAPSEWLENYPDASFQIVSPDEGLE
ncbi:MAG: ATP-binding protein [Candidatus Magasanikbacteria bacterium]|nr:ATP-binding protein [Candidatus Magasanikbacteria bacterium]